MANAAYVGVGSRFFLNPRGGKSSTLVTLGIWRKASRQCLSVFLRTYGFLFTGGPAAHWSVLPRIRRSSEFDCLKEGFET